MADTIATMTLEIVTPQATVLSEAVDIVTLPCADGEITVYPQHVRVIARLTPGEVLIHRSGRDDRSLAIGEGLVEIGADRVSIVTDMAIPADRIDEAKVEEARARAEARLREQISDEEVATVNASLARSLAQLQIKRRRRG
jgi:F-type H+-transporting ATPase subunit epsilon